MADELTTTGLSIDDLETRRANVVADLRAQISAILDVSPDQPTGQLTDIYLESLQNAMELLQEVYASFDPAQATGISLDAICSITGTYRNPATYGTVTLTLNLNAATTVPAGSQAAVSGDSDNIWVTTAGVTSVGAGNYDVDAIALETGDIEAPAGTITVIVTPVAGWNTVTNAADAVPGDEIETDSELRLRRVTELSLGGSTSTQAIQAEISELSYINNVIVYANDYWRAAAPMPPHSIEVVTWTFINLTAAQVAEMAELIYTEKASGIQAYGSDIGDGSGDPNTTHIDDYGNAHVIGWTRATNVTIHIDIDISTAGDTTDEYIGDIALRGVIVNWGLELDIGADLIYFQVLTLIMNQDGIENITSLEVDIVDPPVGTVDIVIGPREKAYIAGANIDITGPP